MIRSTNQSMPTEHIVQQGECLSSIAKRYGFVDWNTIYDDDLNSAFREARSDPHVLYPGDRLFIPDKQIKSAPVQTSMRHTFRLVKKQTRLRIVVIDIDGELLAGKRYKLTVGGVIHEGVLPNDSRINLPIPADAMDGELRVWADEVYDDYSLSWVLKLGQLDPPDTLTGIQSRLNNLGYDSGPIDGINGPRTKAAVKAFQRDHGLDVDGVAGPKTQSALKNKYRC